MSGPRWFWYISRVDELMLDIDTRAPGGSFLGPTRRRLRAAVEGGILSVKSVHIFRSSTETHLHLIIRLDNLPPEDTFHRRVRLFTWEMQLRSDLYRGRCNLARALEDMASPGLLISPAPWSPFYREPDLTCHCPEKHDLKMMASCYAARRCRGGAAATWQPFGELPQEPCVPGITVPFGEIELETFLK